MFQDQVQTKVASETPLDPQSPDIIPLFVADLKAMIRGRKNHPSIVQWTIFNEENSYKVFTNPPYDLKGMVDLVRELDPTRLVDSCSGSHCNDLHLGSESLSPFSLSRVHSMLPPRTPNPHSIFEFR